VEGLVERRDCQMQAEPILQGRQRRRVGRAVAVWRAAGGQSLAARVFHSVAPRLILIKVRIWQSCLKPLLSSGVFLHHVA
jgi:hypothetical protein